MLQELINELIKAGNDTELRRLRDTYDYPIKNGLAMQCDIELVDQINNYFMAQKSIEDEIERRCSGLNGTHEMNFKYDFYTVSAEVECQTNVDWSVGLNETHHNIKSLTIEQ